jgi:hypothetical protein
MFSDAETRFRLGVSPQPAGVLGKDRFFGTSSRHNARTPPYGWTSTSPADPAIGDGPAAAPSPQSAPLPGLLVRLFLQGRSGLNHARMEWEI